MTGTTDFPPPWRLTGDGLILCYRPERAWLDARPDGWCGGLAFVMWVNYRSSPVGPYREWLLIPGKRTNPRGRHYSISDIFVDSSSSLAAGRQNWGIPKDYADFEWRDDGGALSLSVEATDRAIQLTGAPRGPTVPVPAVWHPYRLYQQRDGRHYWTRPTASGRCRWFSVVNQAEEGAGAPALASQRLVAALLVRDFRMQFPVAELAVSSR